MNTTTTEAAAHTVAERAPQLMLVEGNEAAALGVALARPDMVAVYPITPQTSLVEKLAKSADWVTYDLPPELLGKVWKGKYRGQKQKWFLFRFLGADSDVDIRTEHPEFSVWAWKSHAEVLESIVPFKRPVYEQVFSEFRNWLR